eukprot:scaffold240253_cov14-Tisochrysis_lutea.AAC.1
MKRQKARGSPACCHCCCCCCCPGQGISGQGTKGMVDPSRAEGHQGEQNAQLQFHAFFFTTQD